MKSTEAFSSPPSSGTEARNGERGRIDKAIVTKYLSNNEIKDSIFYVCGPPGMVNEMQNLIQKLQIQKEKLEVEEFTGY
jgi:ferredoxin-NADP reductase